MSALDDARKNCQQIWEQQAQAKVGSYADVTAALDVLEAAVRQDERRRVLRDVCGPDPFPSAVGVMRRLTRMQAEAEDAETPAE